MKKPVIIGILLVLVIGSFVVAAIEPVHADPVMRIDEFQLTTDPADQSEPEIDGGRIVWQDNRNGNWDIYMLSDAPPLALETQITTDSSNQQYPVIQGDRIVYADDRNGNWDIYLYDLVTRTETRITNNTADQRFPAIYGNRIIWQDSRDGHLEIYMYDLGTHAETRVTNSINSQSAAVYGDRFVYQKTVRDSLGYDHQNICLFDPVAWRETLISQYAYGESYPAIYNDQIVWADDFFDILELNTYTYILLYGPQTPWYGTQITSQYQHRKDPDIYWDANLKYIVYEGNNAYYDNTGDWDIYLYNLDTRTETRVTNNSANQFRPMVSGGRIVWQDYRNGNWDIYMAKISYSNPDAAPAPGTAEPGSAPDAGMPSTGFVTLNTTFVDIPALKFTGPPAPETGGTEKTAALIKALQRDGFTVQEGRIAYFDLIKVYNAGVMPSAYGNNPSTKYLLYFVPPAPGHQVPELFAKIAATVGISPNFSSFWNLGPDEAVIFVGKTPPECRYFSYDHYLVDRTYGTETRWIFANVADPLNNLVINTEGTPDGSGGNPFNQTTVIVTTADAGIDQRIRAAARSAGYGVGVMNTQVLPSAMLNLGLENSSDTFAVILRPALYKDQQAGDDYLNNTPAVVLRITPNKTTALDPYEYPELRVRGTGITEFDLLDDLEELRTAVLARNSGLNATELPVSQLAPAGSDAIQRGIDALIPDNDACYLWTGNQIISSPTPPFPDLSQYYEFLRNPPVTLGNGTGECIIVYGVNHVATGKAMYQNFGPFGADIWNGVGAITDVDFNGTAEEYLPDNPNAKYLYVYKLARNCEGDVHCFEVPYGPGGYGIRTDQPLFIFWRTYLEKATRTGPSYAEIVYDRAIKFDPI